MDIIKTVLVRLKDINENDNVIAAFHTTNPSELLKMYYFCQENNLAITASNADVIGTISDISILFGGNKFLPCIDVWVEKW